MSIHANEETSPTTLLDLINFLEWLDGDRGGISWRDENETYEGIAKEYLEDQGVAQWETLKKSGWDEAALILPNGDYFRQYSSSRHKDVLDSLEYNCRTLGISWPEYKAKLKIVSIHYRQQKLDLGECSLEEYEDGLR